MHICHEEIFISDDGFFLFLGASMDGDELPEYIVIPYPYITSLSGELEILRRCANGCAMKNLTIFSNGGPAFNKHMGLHDGMRAELHMLADY